MKTNKKLVEFALVLFLSTVFPALVQGYPSGKGGSLTQQSPKNATPLDMAEVENLLFMREEEKMSHDVYQTLYKIWNKVVFKNIAASEQRHTNAVLKKINLFGLIDPALPEAGRYSNPDLQAFYEQLIAQGKRSYIDALRVGATIEDVDIRDLRIAIEETSNLALKTTYENLLEGSKNHLRAFVGLLQKQGIEYSPQYMDQDLYDAILGI